MTIIAVDGIRPADTPEDLGDAIRRIEGVREIRAEIVGRTPFLFNRYFDEKWAASVIGNKPTNVTLVDEWRRKEAMLRLYENAEGLCIPSRNIRSAMVAGGNGVTGKLGRGEEVKIGQFVREGLIPEPAFISFLDANGRVLQREDATALHKDQVRIPPGPKGALVDKYWPKLEVGWVLRFSLLVFDGGLPEEKLLACLTNAGVFKGIGTGRPDYGKFKVTEWTEVAMLS